MEPYTGVALREDIVVDELVTVHYFEYTSSYFFPGEAHDFWEFLYVDKGEVAVTAGASSFSLKNGELVFHKPMEFHSLRSNGIVAPNLVVISFYSTSPAMEFFHNKRLRVGGRERDLLAQIIREAKDAYRSALDDPGLRCMERREAVPFGAEQMIKLSLETLLISFVRAGAHAGVAAPPRTSGRENVEDDVYRRILDYLDANITGRLTLDRICRDNLIGRSYLQKIFRQNSGGGVMEYFGTLKIASAKQRIRQNSSNFTEISRELGYSSIHYFSRQFKKITGMTPSEYSSSVKIRSEAVGDIANQKGTAR